MARFLTVGRLLALGLATLLLTSQATADEEPQRHELVIETRNLERLVDNGDYPAAVESGKRLVLLHMEAFGRNSIETARALSALAGAQALAGDPASARENYQAAIAIIEDLQDHLSEELVDPLTGLGRTTLNASRPDLASEALERALHVNQVNTGPQNLEQVPLLYDLTEAYYQLGDFKQAEALQRYAVGLYERLYPKDDNKEIIPALYKRASWQNRMGMFMDEQRTYMKIIRIVERVDGRASLDLIPALTRLGRTYLFSAEPDAFLTGQRRLKRAINIAKKNDDATPVIHAETELALGDFHTLTGDRTSARRAYVRAWDLMTADDLSLLTARDERFDTPQPLRQITPPEQFRGTAGAELREALGREPQFGYVTVAYDVNTRGTPENLRVVESVPKGLKDREALGWVRRLRFRPRFDERKPVTTPDEEFRYEFRYFPSVETDGISAEPEATTVAESDDES
ncbi:MAG: TonB family protein [Pseudomonadota bacterium]